MHPAGADHDRPANDAKRIIGAVGRAFRRAPRWGRPPYGVDIPTLQRRAGCPHPAAGRRGRRAAARRFEAQPPAGRLLARRSPPPTMVRGFFAGAALRRGASGTPSRSEAFRSATARRAALSAEIAAPYDSGMVFALSRRGRPLDDPRGTTGQARARWLGVPVLAGQVVGTARCSPRAAGRRRLLRGSPRGGARPSPEAAEICALRVDGCCKAPAAFAPGMPIRLLGPPPGRRAAARRPSGGKPFGGNLTLCWPCAFW